MQVIYGQMDIGDFSKCFANLVTCMWWIEDCQRGSWVNAPGILGVYVWCVDLWMHFYIKMLKILFVKIQKYVFTDSFGNHLTITYSFGNLANVIEKNARLLHLNSFKLYVFNTNGTS